MIRGGCMGGNSLKNWLTAKTAALLVLACLGGFPGFGTGLVHARNALPSGTPGTISATELPVQGRDMMALVYQGGPFRHDKDGVVFGNRERLLPAHSRGYYREYTVRTPGERSRGARRIVCGGEKPAAPDACYYTDDHYASFRKIIR